MQILCAISGITFDVQHFPATLTQRECMHPVFILGQKRLLHAIPRYKNGGLTDTDKFLLFAALLHSTEAVEFRVPLVRSSDTQAIIASNMESLFRIIIKCSELHNRANGFSLPHIAITPDNNDLANIGALLRVWDTSITEYLNGCKDSNIRQRIKNKEAILERYIKDSTKNPALYAKLLAQWAAVAAHFPVSMTLFGTNEIAISAMWQDMIICAAKKENLHKFALADWEELLEHCEQHIDLGSIYSHKLFELLRYAISIKNGMGNLLLTTSSKSRNYIIMEDNTETMQANIAAMILQAPDEEPVIGEYPDKISYMRARARWEMKFKQDQQTVQITQVVQQIVPKDTSFDI